MPRPLDFIKYAPCYWEVADDGARWKCSECAVYGKASEMFGILTPDKQVGVVHKKCVDEDWISKAQRMEGKI